MKRHFLTLLCALFAFSITYSLVCADNQADSLDVPIKTIILKAPEPSVAKKSPVLFAHSTHLRFSCTACHHNWDRVSPVQGCSASGCHEQLMPSAPKGKPSQAKEVMSITGAYHRACRSCHRDQQQQLKEMGVKASELEAAVPVACDGCHPKTFKGEESLDGHLTIPLGTLTLAPPEDAVSKRAEVNFPHGLHFDQNCEVCHHEWDGVSDVESCMTSGCHDIAEADESTRDINDPVNVQYFLTAYHKACYQCHRDLNKEAKLSSAATTPPPVLCNDCHNAD